MKESELNAKISESLSAFESLEPLQPTMEWQKSLAGKIDTVKYKGDANIISSQLVIALFIVLLVNIVLIVSSMNDSKSSASNRSSELQRISNEILINPASLSN